MIIGGAIKGEGLNQRLKLTYVLRKKIAGFGERRRGISNTVVAMLRGLPIVGIDIGRNPTIYFR